MRNTMMIFSILFSNAAAAADEILLEISWTQLQRDGLLEAGEVLPADEQTPSARLKIDNRSDAPRKIRILTIHNPSVTETVYAVTGQVRHEIPSGEGMLELLSYFQTSGPYFSRTQGRDGPMRSLKGSSGWRPFVLPFFLGDSSVEPPTKLELNVALPDRSTVYLTSVRLAQYEKGEDPFGIAGQWWSDPSGGLLGAVLGVSLGCIGALIGTLWSLGKARRLVVGLLAGMFVVGLVLLAAGVIALVRSQPYGVYYPLLLTGLICTILPGVLLPGIRRRYEEIELRKMQALDASGLGDEGQ